MWDRRFRLSGLFLFILLAFTQLSHAQPIELTVFSDFQCPFCAKFAQPIRELQTKGVPGVETKVTFKHFPLNFHPDAEPAARAALAAAAQGKFWEMHDLIFANQSALKREDLLRYAEKLNLDMERFRKDFDSEETRKLVAADLAEGQKLGVQGTPTFFVNGKSYSGAQSFDQLKNIIQGEQRRAQALSEISADQMSKGPPDAPITLELFADLTSPVSLPALSVLEDAMQRYSTAVRLQFRNFPLAFHPQAALAHEAAMIAAREGRFWELASFVLSHPDSIREQDLIAYAGKVGLDENKFAETVRERKYTARVEADVMEGLKRGLRGSPVIFVNDKRIDGVPSIQTLIEHIEAELAPKK